MNCESLSDEGGGVLSCNTHPPQVNLWLESGPLQIKLFDLAPLALASAPVLRCRVHEQLWPIDRGSCVARICRCFRISIQFMSEFEGEKKKNFSCRNKDMSTSIHFKKKDCISVSDEHVCLWNSMWLFLTMCVNSCLNCSLCWYLSLNWCYNSLGLHCINWTKTHFESIINIKYCVNHIIV